jgi:creatinine amidohydrolase/Fe(II)-dependent formamide hydrolase-like protein
MKKQFSLSTLIAIIFLTVGLSTSAYAKDNVVTQKQPPATKAEDSVLAQLQPSATQEEREMYSKIKNNPVEVRKFIATRQYFRKIRELFPDGKVDVKNATERAPLASEDVQLAYISEENDRQELGWLFTIDYSFIKRGIKTPER